MKTFAISSYGSHLGKIDLSKPEPAPGDVLVAIGAATVNPIDERVRSGAFKQPLPMRMPLVLGQDFVGTVIGSGSMRPVIDERYAFGKTHEALAHVAEAHSRGKVVIKTGAAQYARMA